MKGSGKLKGALQKRGRQLQELPIWGRQQISGAGGVVLRPDSRCTLVNKRKYRCYLLYLWESTVLWEDRQCRMFIEGEARAQPSTKQRGIVQSTGF